MENEPTLLAQQRMRRKLSLEAVAEVVGTTYSTLSRIERGVQTPKQQLARDLFEFFERRVPLGAIYDATFAAQFPKARVRSKR